MDVTYVPERMVMLLDMEDSGVKAQGPSCLAGWALGCAWAMSVTGCSSGLVYDTPYLRTQIVDAKTRQPIESARVEVWAVRREDLVARGATDSQGQVFVAPSTHKAYRFGPYDTYPPPGRVRVSASGYLATEAAVSFGAGRTPMIALVPAT